VGKFADLARKLKRRGAKHPDALAAYIGREKYGRRGMEARAGAGRKRAKIRR